MKRFISSSVTSILLWVGYDRHKLPTEWKTATEIYVTNGAVGKVGQIDTIEILHRPRKGPSPIHKSAFNPSDKVDIISARITPKNGSYPLTHHIYKNGTGTLKKDDRRE
ncbi:hypothetical protein AGABI1DRAFT_132418 [Agaricus bisporus var. burnettii JB137-S8]|uniref:Uncharacterized protein n=1 Tax=Agaricus bisporus var. burnettii (strain JB137-S8 / ATCC MYA-4627 / FGSC 10392) TaxID=597362 RepID=K5VLK2_AGABU|nr:uncharacterized protein AGABI1DRAFT_132418 [Agaricus bisporus var. burnettii JB137-S8]EKM75279.1 hypothetical protein AGABI1DRAFT_132418 [Agaricus bisporus var. burnettii JB137-S8]